jgi:hypothetical protein
MASPSQGLSSAVGWGPLAALVVAGTIGLLLYTHEQRPRAVATPYADACEATQSLARHALVSEAIHDLKMGDCPYLNLREQKDLSWLANGSSTGTRYGAPVALEWSARVAVFPDGARLCNFGFDASRNPRTPTSLVVEPC